jgi:hypothetical protein
VRAKAKPRRGMEDETADVDAPTEGKGQTSKVKKSALLLLPLTFDF